MSDKQQLNIALLGAPGSGKSSVARKIVALTKQSNALGEWGVVDGYVEALSKSTGLIFGPASNFPQNLSVITTRWVKESELYSKGLNVITCGSIYESILYSTLPTMFKTEEEFAANTAENIFNQIMLQALGALEKTTYHYDAMFFIPFTEKVRLKNERTWAGVVNAKLPEILEGFTKQVILLDQKTVQDKAEYAIQGILKIKEIYAQIIAANVESGV